MKSLAHPDWPYTGTPWEWRGFAQNDSPAKSGGNTSDVSFPSGEPIDWYPGETRAEALERCAIYQKQNFGPGLD